MLEELDQLLDHVATHPEAQREFVETNTEEALAWLRSHPTMAEPLERFLQRHGHRGYRELCLRDPAWGDDPTPLVQSMQAAVHARLLTGGRREISTEAVDTTTLSRGLRWVLPKAHNAIRRREHTKSQLVDLAHRFQIAFRHLGEQLTAENTITDPDLVNFFPITELGDAHRPPHHQRPRPSTRTPRRPRAPATPRVPRDLRRPAPTSRTPAYRHQRRRTARPTRVPRSRRRNRPSRPHPHRSSPTEPRRDPRDPHHRHRLDPLLQPHRRPRHRPRQLGLPRRRDRPRVWLALHRQHPASAPGTCTPATGSASTGTSAPSPSSRPQPRPPTPDVDPSGTSGAQSRRHRCGTCGDRRWASAAHAGIHRPHDHRCAGWARRHLAAAHLPGTGVRRLGALLHLHLRAEPGLERQLRLPTRDPGLPRAVHGPVRARAAPPSRHAHRRGPSPKRPHVATADRAGRGAVVRRGHQCHGEPAHSAVPRRARDGVVHRAELPRDAVGPRRRADRQARSRGRLRGERGADRAGGRSAGRAPHRAPAVAQLDHAAALQGVLRRPAAPMATFPAIDRCRETHAVAGPGSGRVRGHLGSSEDGPVREW